MWNNNHAFAQHHFADSALRLLTRAGQFTGWVVVGLFAGIGILICLPLATLIVGYKLKLNGSLILLLFGLLLLCVVAGIVMLGYLLLKQIARLMRSSANPQSVPFLTYVTTALTMVCLS